MNDSFAEEKSQKCEKMHHDIAVPDCLSVDVKKQSETYKNAATFKANDGSYVFDFNNTMYNKNLVYNEGTPHNWWTGITLYRIGEIDTVKGTYEMYFNHWVQLFENNDTMTDFKKEAPDLDYVFSVGKPDVTLSKGIIQKKNYYDVMVDGKFYTDMGFQKFPFEQLDLKIIVEPSYNYASGSQKDSIQFHMWPYSGLEPNAPSPGYEIISYDISVIDNQYSEGDTYSRYEINYKVQRQILDSFLKFIFPIMIMSFLAISTILFPSEMYMTKISLNAIFLIGMLFFVQSVQEKIPNIGDMTIFDYVVIMSYGIIVVAIMTPAMKWKRRNVYELDKAKRDDWKDKDRRNHDLNMENLRRTEADIVFFKDKLKRCKKGTDEHKDITEVIMHLIERRENLDKLKNIDSKISLLAKIRTDFSEERIYYSKNLSPVEIRQKVNNYTKGKEITLTENERKMLEQIKKPLEEYEKISADIISRKQKSGAEDQITFDPRQAKLKIQGLALNNAWKKYRKIIRKEEMLEEQGTILQLDDLETKRTDVIKRLQELEEITKDNNEEMVINDQRFLDPETREIISKNEIDELNRLDNTNKKFNRLAFGVIGIMAAAGLSYIIGAILI